MANPRLRILLVDEKPSRLMSIEKNLSGLGYSRVAPLTSMRELLIIVENSLCDFDLLVINDTLLSRAGTALEQMVRSCPIIKNILVYQGGDLELSSVTYPPVSSMSFSLSCPPDQESIRQVMNFVDKPMNQKRMPKKCCSGISADVWRVIRH